MSVVMQSAMNALNPVKSIGAQFKDAMRAHGVTSKEEIAGRSAEVLRMVGIDPVHLRSYPHQLSGGMRQRAMIAMALLFTPDLVIMDEPTSALDVVAQRSLMVQIKELQRQLGFAVIFVTHDMSLVSHFSDRLMVMYAGQVAEFGATRQRVRQPAAPLQRRPAGRVPVDPGPAGAADRHPRQPARPVPAAAGLPVRPALPEGHAGRAPRPHPELYPVQDTLVRCLLYDAAGGRATELRTGPPVTDTTAEPLLRAEALTRHFKIGGALSAPHAARGRRRRAWPSASARSSRWPARAAAARAPSPGCSPRSTGPPAARSTSPGRPLSAMRSRADLLRYRGEVPMVFQDPFSSINPVFRVSHGVLRA